MVAVTVEPAAVIVAFQDWLIVWPLAKVQVTRQPLIADEPAVTRYVALEVALPLARME